MLNNVIIYGFRYTGKSTIAKALHQKLTEYKYCELDHEIEVELGCSIKDFIAKTQNWQLFREIEHKIFTNLLRDGESGTILSCGGGISANNIMSENGKKYGDIQNNIMQNMQNCIKVLMTVNENDLIERIQTDKSIRPSLLKDDTKLDFISEQILLNQQREKLYLAAKPDIIIDTSVLSLDEAVDNIVFYVDKIKPREEMLKTKTNPQHRKMIIEGLLKIYQGDKQTYGKRIKKLKEESVNLINNKDGYTTFNVKIDISELHLKYQYYIKRAIESFNFNKNARHLIRSLFRSSRFCHFSIDEIEEMERNRKKTIIDLVGIDFIDKTGKTARHSQDEQKNKYIGNCTSLFVGCFSLFCDVILKEFLNKITETIDMFTIGDILKDISKVLVKKNIIPEDRLKTFSIIISYGLYQNYIVTSYMIPAQIEFLLLQMLKHNGDNIATFNGNIVGNDLVLEDLFNDENRHNKLQEILSNKDILDQLKYLFKYNNFRNDIYHGKCNDVYLQYQHGQYLWFLFVKLLYALQYCNKKSENK